jgi:hypothetical protein
MSLSVNTWCPMCSSYKRVEVTEAGYAAWRNQGCVSKRLPELVAEERKLLKSGMCADCWYRNGRRTWRRLWRRA